LYAEKDHRNFRRFFVTTRRRRMRLSGWLRSGSCRRRCLRKSRNRQEPDTRNDRNESYFHRFIWLNRFSFLLLMLMFLLVLVIAFAFPVEQEQEQEQE